MKLKDIIKSNSWLSVELILLQLYPDQYKMLDDYRIVFESLKSIEPEDSKMKIVLTECDSEFDDESKVKTYIDVSGQDDKKDKFGRKISYAIEFTEWNEWLGMQLTQDTLKNFSELEIIAHCLYEMTFISYEEKQIHEVRKSLDKSIDEYKNLTEEEKKQKSISLDELRRKLDEKKGSS